MNNKLKLLLALLTVSSVMGVAAACVTGETNSSSSSQSSSSSEVKKEKYTVIFVDHDDVIISEETYEEGATVEVPADPTRADADGYSYVFAGWDQEVSETATGDATYKATYTQTAIGYKVIFVADGETVEEVPYTVETESIEAPAVPEKAGYTGVWESYELATGDVTVNAVYTAIEYTVSFTNPRTGMPVAAPITYTVENMADIVFPEIPDEIKMEHYTVAWNKTPADVTIGGCDVNPEYTAIEYTVSFTHPKTGMPVAAPIAYTIENMSEIVFPEIPDDLKMDHYTVDWNKTAADVTLGGCDVNPVWTAIEYKVTFVADGKTVAEIPYTVETESIEAPAVPVKEGYGGKWATYTLDGGNKTVEAIYTLGEYTVTFMAGGVEVGKDTYTITDKTVTEPAVPAKEHYENGRWESYTLTTGDITVNAVYDAIEYTVTFKADGVQVGEVLTYTVENTTITEPEVPAKEHYENGAWESYELNGGNVTVNATYTAIEYTVTFLNEASETVGTATYTLENTAISEPAVPEKTGYTGKWADYALSGGDVSVRPEYTANTYTITYDENGGTASTNSQDVLFGDTYSLATATAPKSYQEFLGWADENGNMFVAGEAWDIAGNVTLKAVYSEGIVFETLTAAPTSFSTAGTTASLAITELNGNKVLELKSTDTGTGPALKVTLDFLTEFFENDSVAYLAFDAKSETTQHTNFRRSTIRTTGTTAGSWGQEPYEADVQADNTQVTGIRADAFKTFYFSRTDYNNWVDNNITEDMLICAGNFTAGESLYVDNIRPITDLEYKQQGYGFENGGLRPNGGNLLAYMAHTGSAWQWAITSDTVDGSRCTFTSYGYTNENVSEGNRALFFTKTAGRVTLRFNNTSVQGYTDIGAPTGYWAFDLFVPADADTTFYYSTMGMSNSVILGNDVVKGKWMTVYACPESNVGIVLTDTTGGTYMLDNLRSVSKEEYLYGFEANTGGLRTNLVNDENTHSGAFYWYNRGNDYTGVKASLTVSEGNGENDVNAISNVRMATDIVHSGQYSLAFDKGTGYVAFSRHSESEALTTFAGGFTFWIYSTTGLNGTTANNFINGVNEKFNDGAGITIAANTWTQVTVTAADIDSNGRFLIIQGSTEGTIYIDDFRPL